MKILILISRILFSMIFVLSAFNHFSPETMNYAASHGVPFTSILIPATGVWILAAGLMILFGYKAKIGAWALVIFLVPVTLVMHDFWAVGDPQMAQIQKIMFLKNLSLLGGALLFTAVGSGPSSIDSLMKRQNQERVFPPSKSERKKMLVR